MSVPLEIISDNEDFETPIESKKRIKKAPTILKTCLFEDKAICEIGIDEAGRGPLFGRVYTAAVILPKDDAFDHSKMKDSKLFHSKKKIEEVAEYIKQNAIAWAVTYEDEKVIDEINILQATQKSMHKSITAAYMMAAEKKALIGGNVHLLVDGNYFNTYTKYNKVRKMVEPLPHTCIEGGDNKYTCIAAASILAKVSRDQYISALCEENPELIEKYGINSNKGYGAKKHIAGIKEHGITIWHRRTFGICKNYV
jgi:ribonuclease HII